MDMRGFPKHLNTAEDLEACRRMFPEETKATLDTWVSDSKPVEVADEKTGVKTMVTNISPHLTRLSLAAESAKVVAEGTEELIAP